MMQTLMEIDFRSQRMPKHTLVGTTIYTAVVLAKPSNCGNTLKPFATVCIEKSILFTSGKLEGMVKTQRIIQWAIRSEITVAVKK